MAHYEKRMKDAAADECVVRAEDGEVLITDPNAYSDGDGMCIADLWFTPDGALRFARSVIKAATAAYEQERDAAARL